ncbi:MULTISPECIES: hypothetical protein [unclassified Variovorax]|uniref:hypothetical protein n=1 Tax=unclassified Variovorax TaxID=663243 RepID=UPI0008C6C329|nr:MULTISPECIES: hypothetical protein [unclassified Variovorax]SEJ95344.1 hypothetical protein SAMN05518853_105104 [Variovorax sp. OK202]SFD19044.1 hypothetical protein SAMN05444746_105144 [Variovorax sp. OK212]
MSTTPDHALAGEVRRAVASHLETHEAASAKELERMLAQRVAGYRPEPGSTALRQQLARLADGGHVHSVAVGGRACWKQGPAPLAGRIAAARRVLRLDSSVYAPEAATVVRPGAMDFARIPSLLLGQRSGYWGASR